MTPDYNTLELLAMRLCQLAGGNWDRKRTKRNLWRKRAAALAALANGDKAEAERVMRGEK